jgi:hypothetical protein
MARTRENPDVSSLRSRVDYHRRVVPGFDVAPAAVETRIGSEAQ